MNSPGEAVGFAREAAGDVGVPDTVARIVEQARRALRSEHAGITIRHAGGRLTSTATDPLVRELFELQLLLREGPRIEAGTEQRIARGKGGAVHAIDDAGAR